MIVGVRVILMIFPSFPFVPTVAHTATVLLTQIILPTAPPITWSATINTVGKPRFTADWYCKLVNKELETVLLPETKAPNTPITGAMMT